MQVLDRRRFQLHLAILLIGFVAVIRRSPNVFELSHARPVVFALHRTLVRDHCNPQRGKREEAGTDDGPGGATGELRPRVEVVDTDDHGFIFMTLIFLNYNS